VSVPAAPPPLPRAALLQPEKLILLCSAAVLVAGLWWCAIVAATGGVSWCTWKTVSGLPCVGCGGTRAMLSLAGGQWTEAWLLNPGVAAALLGLVVVNLYAATVLIFRLEPWRPRAVWLGRWRWWIGAAVLANWIYLLAAGRV